MLSLFLARRVDVALLTVPLMLFKLDEPTLLIRLKSDAPAPFFESAVTLPAWSSESVPPLVLRVVCGENASSLLTLCEPRLCLCL